MFGNLEHFAEIVGIYVPVVLKPLDCFPLVFFIIPVGREILFVTLEKRSLPLSLLVSLTFTGDPLIKSQLLYQLS